MRTLVIKLAGTVEDDSLMRLGELRMPVTPVSGQSTQAFFIGANEPITLEITGDGTFTENGAKKLELGAVSRKRVEISNGTFTLSILNKDAVTRLSFFEDYEHNCKIEVKLSQLRTMKNLIELNTERGLVSGDIADITGLINLTTLAIVGVGITGDMREIGDLVNLTNLKIENTYIRGGTSTMSNLTKLSKLELFYLRAGTDMLLSHLSTLSGLEHINILGEPSGDISALAGLTNMTYLYLRDNPRITGSTSSLAALHPNNGGKLATFKHSNTGITGTWPPS